MRTDEWKQHAYAATVDLSAAHLSKRDVDVLAHLRDALENVGKAIDAVENAQKKL